MEHPHPEPRARPPLTIALAGQPNVGKSTVFNVLTGMNQHVGNWPGKTVEQKTGGLDHGGRRLHLVDLPGTYGLSANSEEERIARDFILRERPDVVVAIVNAAALERGLYLVAELLMLPVPVVIGINMVDVAEQHGVHIETGVLEAALGTPVVGLVATKNRGVGELLDAALRLADNPTMFVPSRPAIALEHEQVLRKICAAVVDRLPRPYPADWVALKLLEGDTEVAEMVRTSVPAAWGDIEVELKQHEDAYLDIAGSRYQWIGRMVRAAVIRPRVGALTITGRIDKVATHYVWGPLLAIGMFGITFLLTYTVAGPIVQWLDGLISGQLVRVADSALVGAPWWLSGLLVDGLVGGVGTVLTFIPILIIFFAVLGAIEDVGYMARIAYVMDRLMHWMGLHGKSVLPLVVGLGCNVPGVMGTRIIEERRARLLTILLTPLVPCTARLAVIAFLAPALFGGAATLVSWGLVATNLLILFVVGTVVNRTVFRGERTAFIMEMPLYHRPNLRTISLFVWRSTVAFVRKAGVIIVIVSSVVWILSALPAGDPQHSLLADLGRLLAPVGALAGLGDWRLVVALLSGFAAKENTIATLGVLFPADGSGVGLAARVADVLPPAAGMAFLVMIMTFIPCAAAVAVIKQETRSWRWTAWSVLLMLGIASVAGVLVYQVGSRL